MTPRNDDFDLDDLKSAMTAATPAADPARRAENLALVKKNFEATQGSRTEARQSSDRPQTGGFFKGAFDMLISRTALGGLTATTAIVAVGFFFLSFFVVIFFLLLCRINCAAISASSRVRYVTSSERARATFGPRRVTPATSERVVMVSGGSWTYL